MNYQNNENRQQSNNFADNDPYFKDKVNDTTQNSTQNQNTRDDPFAASNVNWQNQQGYQGYQSPSQDPYDPYAQFYHQAPQKSPSVFDRMFSNAPAFNIRSAVPIILKALLFVLLFIAIQSAVVIIAEIPMTMELMAEGISDPNELNDLIYERISKYGNYLSALSGALTVLIVFIIFVCKRQNPFKELSFTKTRISTVLVCIAAGFALNFSCNVLFMFMPQSWLENYTQASENLDTGSLFSYVLGGVIIAPIVEEIIFRGILTKRFGKCMPSIFAAVLSAVVFGACHGDLVWMIYAGSLGIILGVIFSRFESIIPCIFLHLSFNSVSAIMRVVYEIPAIKNMSAAQEMVFNGAYTLFSFAMVAVSVALVTVLMTSKCFLVKNEQKEFFSNNE